MLEPTKVNGRSIGTIEMLNGNIEVKSKVIRYPVGVNEAALQKFEKGGSGKGAAVDNNLLPKEFTSREVQKKALKDVTDNDSAADTMSWGIGTKMPKGLDAAANKNIEQAEEQAYSSSA